MDSNETDHNESVSTIFEWTIRSLKQAFDSSRGDTKSRVIKSPRFGGGGWQILFYANAGTLKESVGSSEGGGFISLFLACEPTAEEKEAAVGDSGKWVREGVYKFSFELRNVEKTVLHNLKEASNHTFSYKTANWGWAQFARRDAVYYQSAQAKSQDAFVIVCTITSSPKPVSLVPVIPRLSIPKPLLDTVGSLLDDPCYSDVEFVVLRRNQDHRKARRIWASRKMLRRADYFDAMLGDNFAEGTADYNPLHTPRLAAHSLTSPVQSDAGGSFDEYIDSDDEDDDYHDDDADEDEVSSQMDTSDNDFINATNPQEDDNDNVSFQQAESITDDESRQNDQSLSQSQSDTASIISIPSIPTAPHSDVTSAQAPKQHTTKPRLTVVIKDVAYNTYRALLYYLYTDSIVFAPLSSSFTSPRPRSSAPPASTSLQAPSEVTLTKRQYNEVTTSRKEWIKEWMKSNPGRPAPCSAKAIYREADRLDLKSLKERAAQHIFKSLTVENIAYEVFSPFASTFEEIRKVEIDYFLRHWENIRSSEAMKSVWQQIRNGRHPGFEEVWPSIAMNLEFKPAALSSVTHLAKSEPAQQVSL